MRTIEQVSLNPLAGDRVVQRKGYRHQNRLVISSTGEKVWYDWHDHHYDGCTIEEWREFCDGARVSAFGNKARIIK